MSDAQIIARDLTIARLNNNKPVDAATIGQVYRDLHGAVAEAK